MNNEVKSEDGQAFVIAYLVESVSEELAGLQTLQPSAICAFVSSVVPFRRFDF